MPANLPPDARIDPAGTGVGLPGDMNGRRTVGMAVATKPFMPETTADRIRSIIEAGP